MKASNKPVSIKPTQLIIPAYKTALVKVQNVIFFGTVSHRFRQFFRSRKQRERREGETKGRIKETGIHMHYCLYSLALLLGL